MLTDWKNANSSQHLTKVLRWSLQALVQHPRTLHEVLEEKMALPVHDMLWETQLPKSGSQTSNPLLKLVSLTRVTGSRHNGHMHITTHEVDDVANHLAVVLHVGTVSIQCAISIKGDQLQACC